MVEQWRAVVTVQVEPATEPMRHQVDESRAELQVEYSVEEGVPDLESKVLPKSGVNGLRFLIPLNN